jgi:hypothetical protein
MSNQLLKSRTVAGEEEEADVIFTGDSQPEFYYEEGEIEEVEQIEEIVYEIYDAKEIDPSTQEQILSEAGSILFWEEQINESNEQSKQSTRLMNPTATVDKKARPGIGIKLKRQIDNNLADIIAPNREVQNPLTVQIGATLRNTRASGINATKQSRLAKEDVMLLNESLAKLTQDEIKGVLGETIWLNSLVVEKLEKNK